MADGETKRPTCETCPHRRSEEIQPDTFHPPTTVHSCHRHAPCFGWPPVKLTDGCGDHPVSIALEQTATQAPMARFFADRIDDLLTRLGR